MRAISLANARFVSALKVDRQCRCRWARLVLLRPGRKAAAIGSITDAAMAMELQPRKDVSLVVPLREEIGDLRRVVQLSVARRYAFVLGTA